MATKNNRLYTIHIGKRSEAFARPGYGTFENSITMTKISLTFRNLDSFDKITKTLQEAINDFNSFIKNNKNELKQFRIIRNDYMKMSPFDGIVYCSFRFIKKEPKEDVIIDFDTPYKRYTKMTTYAKMLQTALDELKDMLEGHTR